MEVEASQAEGRQAEGQEVKHPVWYMTSDEYLQLLKDCLQEFGDEPGRKWHPEDLFTNLEAIDCVVRQVFAVVAEHDREQRTRT